MTRAGQQPGLRAENLLAVLIGRSAPWALAAGLLTALVYLVVDGLEGALAALLGLGLVMFFFGVDIVVLALTKHSPAAVTVAALLSDYLVKVLVLAVVLWSLAESTALDLQATAVDVVVTTVVGGIALTAAAIRTKSFYFDDPVSKSAAELGEDGNPMT
jgi:ATP synthase protein I